MISSGAYVTINQVDEEATGYSPVVHNLILFYPLQVPNAVEPPLFKLLLSDLRVTLNLLITTFFILIYSSNPFRREAITMISWYKSV